MEGYQCRDRVKDQNRILGKYVFQEKETRGIWEVAKTESVIPTKAQKEEDW